jgi:hypothetical protein
MGRCDVKDFTMGATLRLCDKKINGLISRPAPAQIAAKAQGAPRCMMPTT